MGVQSRQSSVQHTPVPTTNITMGKKKLRTLLRKKAAEELKKEQERKAEERLRVIAERCGTKADIENASVDDLKKICQQYFDKWYKLEAEMFFLQREVILRDLQINELTIPVSDMKGKFIKPTLKKVSKYENKFAKLQEKAAKFAFANQLPDCLLCLTALLEWLHHSFTSD